MIKANKKIELNEKTVEDKNCDIFAIDSQTCTSTLLTYNVYMV